MDNKIDEYTFSKVRSRCSKQTDYSHYLDFCIMPLDFWDKTCPETLKVNSNADSFTSIIDYASLTHQELFQLPQEDLPSSLELSITLSPWRLDSDTHDAELIFTKNIMIDKRFINGIETSSNKYNIIFDQGANQVRYQVGNKSYPVLLNKTTFKLNLGNATYSPSMNNK